MSRFPLPLRDGVPVAGATGQQHRLPAADASWFQDPWS